MKNGNRKVLIVEDNLILNMLYEEYLMQLGFETKGELVYGKTAVETAMRIDPDLILMDITLEGDMDGIDAMLEIRKFSQVPVIFITGLSDSIHINRAKQIGYLAYLTKPIAYDDLKYVLMNI